MFNLGSYLKYVYTAGLIYIVIILALVISWVVLI
jgi:hypothetical protein